MGRVTPAKMQGFKHTGATRTEVRAAWQEVVRQVLDNDLELAVEVERPGPCSRPRSQSSGDGEHQRGMSSRAPIILPLLKPS